MGQNSIKVKNYSDVMEEYPAGAGITPGHLVSLASTGKVVVHPTAGASAVAMFAVEDELQGKTINEAFVLDDKVQVWIPGRGDQVYAIIPDGQNIAIGDLLESNGTGMLQKVVQASAADKADLGIVAVALEAVDLSDTSGAESSGPLGYDKRIIVRIV